MSTNRKQLHERLWAAAEQLRANSSLKLNEMSEPILGLIFLKFADVKFRRAKAEIEKEREKLTGRKPPLTPDHYKQRGVPFIPDEAGYSHLMNMPEGENIGKAINDAMKAIEQENRELAGILPQDYTALSNRPTENSRILLQLLKNFNQIPDDIEGDAFGEIYEYFLGEFARAEGQKGGEFFTPPSIVKLLVEIIEPYHGKIFDPACGSGGMFVQSANFVARHQKNKRPIMEEVGIYGQEKGANNMRIAKMNLAIHGLSGKIENENSFYVDAHKSIGQFDFVLANPPFNVKGKDKNKQIVIDPARLQGDKRFNYGLPLTGKKEISNANYLWIQMFASALNEKGRAGFVMHNSASDAANAEKEIRKKLIDAGLVDVVIAVGGNMFLNVTLSATLWFLDKGKKGTKREDSVLFINVADIGTPIEGERVKLYWTDEQLSYISGIVKSYRGEPGSLPYKDERGRCRVVSRAEIASSEYSLNPRLYIENPEKVKQPPFSQQMSEIHSFVKAQTESSSQADKLIATVLDDYSASFSWDDLNFGSTRVLEKIANTLFTEWFINYKFPGHEKISLVDSKSKFGNIPEGWEVKQVKDLLSPVKRKKKLKTDEYLEIGKYPIVDQGQSFIAGYTNEERAVYNQELIVFGDHTRCFKYCNFPFACGADGTQLIFSADTEKMPQNLFYLSLINAGLQNYEYARHFKFLKILRILVPDEATAQKFIKVTEPIFEKIKVIRISETNISKFEF